MVPHLTTWQQELAKGFNNSKQLCEYLQLSTDQFQVLEHHNFAVRVPREFCDRMEKGNPNDPLLKQILPIEQENFNPPDFVDDPVGDLNALATSGVIHKYHDRVLLITTGSCAINCRYCFRRNFPYAESQLSQSKLSQAIQYIRKKSQLQEVILSGGDPLLVNDAKLNTLLEQLNSINHIKRIRIHSRIPVVLPSRVTEQFCDMLTAVEKKMTLVLHCNHPKELNASVQKALSSLHKQGITLLNQSVLLKDINDTPSTLIELSEKLFSFHTLPYYLHLLDKASGTHHFEVKEEEAIKLMNAIKQKLPGYLVPKLVREEKGAKNKIVLG